MAARAVTAGEAWARDELARARAARWTPRATAAFLAAAGRRARDTRRSRPALARQARRWEATGAAAWAALAAVGAEPFRRRLGPGLAGWAASGAMLEWHLGMVETPAGEPRVLGAADAVTLARAWLAPAVAGGAHPRLCLAGFVSDAVDGPLARAGRPTRLGRDLETVADGAFGAAVLLGAVRARRVPPAVVALEALRAGAALATALGAYLGAAVPPPPAVARAGRRSAPLRAGGLVALTAGRRRTGTVLTAAGSLAGTAALLRARERAGPSSDRPPLRWPPDPLSSRRVRREAGWSRPRAWWAGRSPSSAPRSR